MWRNLPFSLSALVLLSKPLWAQDSDRIHFINSDFSGIAAGTPFEIGWSGGEHTQPAKVVLVKGPAENLQTVETIADSALSPTFWIPEQSLPAGIYALSITQGDSTNYSPRFEVANAYNPGGTGVGVGASAPSSSSTGGTGSSSEVLYPTLTLTFGQSNVTNGGASASTTPATKTLSSFPRPYPYAYSSAGIGGHGAGNGSTQGVATGYIGSEYKVLGFTGGAERRTWASFGILVAGAGVGIVFGGGSGW